MRPSVIGAIVVAGAALALVIVLSVARAPRGPAREYLLFLSAAPGLRDGAPVRYRGLEVGHVREMALTDTGVLVTLAIHRADLSLRAADSARVVTQGLLGDRVVDILPGDPRAAALVPGRALPARPVLDLDIVAQLTQDLADCRRSARAGAADSPPRTDPADTGGRDPGS